MGLILRKDKFYFNLTFFVILTIYLIPLNIILPPDYTQSYLSSDHLPDVSLDLGKCDLGVGVDDGVGEGQGHLGVLLVVQLCPWHDSHLRDVQTGGQKRNMYMYCRRTKRDFGYVL